ncbi:MAG: FecR family protein [Gammaproteobacteria bacterium]
MLTPAFRPFLSAITILIIIAAVAVAVEAEGFKGKLIKVNGQATIIDANGQRVTVDKPGDIVRVTDTIETATDASAVVSFNDGTLSILDQESRLRVEKTGWLSHVGGKIYFTYRKIFGESRRVKTRFAILGIRGTTFIVHDIGDSQGIALAEGLLDIQTPGAAFEIHRQAQLDQFGAFKQQSRQQREAVQQAFNEYKQALKRDFIEFKKSFRLQANRVVRFEGNRVEERRIDDAIKAEFEYFESIAGELLDEFREQSSPHFFPGSREQAQDSYSKAPQ